jgi:hypothetical protein
MNTNSCAIKCALELRWDNNNNNIVWF